MPDDALADLSDLRRNFSACAATAQERGENGGNTPLAPRPSGADFSAQNKFIESIFNQG